RHLRDLRSFPTRRSSDLAKEFGRSLVQEQELAAIAELEQDMEVNELSAEEVARLREAVKPVVDRFAEEVGAEAMAQAEAELAALDRKSTRLNSSHVKISY